MKATGNTILITGGATGIGLSLAEYFVNVGNEVVICSRRDSRLKDAKKKIPQIHIIQCDVSVDKQRESLVQRVKDEFKNLNVLINNAGIQRRIDLTGGIEDLLNGEDEIRTNLVAPIHLAALFIPFLREKTEAAIINVTSGLAFAPIARMPVYCATKSALHSFTMSLRFQLRDTSIKVFEIIPPGVDTELGIPMAEKGIRSHGGIPASLVAKTTLEAFAADNYEIYVGEVKNIVEGARGNPGQSFKRMNSR